MEQHIKKEMDLEDIPSFTFPINSRSSSSSLDDIGYTEHPMEYYRAVSCQTGLLTNPHGSVKLFQGKVGSCTMILKGLSETES